MTAKHYRIKIHDTQNSIQNEKKTIHISDNNISMDIDYYQRNFFFFLNV